MKYAASANEEHWLGKFDSRDDAIREVFEENPCADVCYVTEAHDLDVMQWVDAEDNLDRIYCGLDDFFENSQDVFEPTDAQIKLLNDRIEPVFRAWLTECKLGDALWEAKHPYEMVQRETAVQLGLASPAIEEPPF